MLARKYKGQAMSPNLGLFRRVIAGYCLPVRRRINEVTGAADDGLESVPWRPEALEPLRKNGRMKVLTPMVIQRSRFLTDDPGKAPEPSDGLFYWVRYPLGWYPLAYRFDDFRELDHNAFWQEHAAPVLACLWGETTGIDANQLERELCPRHYAFPRGRVERFPRAAQRVLYGEALPASITRNMINQAFGLPAWTPWERDLHEACLMADQDYVRKRLNITETWSAVDQSYRHVRVRSPKPD